MFTLVYIVALLATTIKAESGVSTDPARPNARSTTMDIGNLENAQSQPLDPLLHLAMLDLSRTHKADLADIQVIEVRAVVWPDRSFGCPRPGLNYPQVQQDGALIRLRLRGREFVYHSGGGKPPFLCEQRP
jgi:hypothetical protein